jgi:hypothetical protein
MTATPANDGHTCQWRPHLPMTATPANGRHWGTLLISLHEIDNFKIQWNTSSQWPRWSPIFPIFGRMTNHRFSAPLFRISKTALMVPTETCHWSAVILTICKTDQKQLYQWPFCNSDFQISTLWGINVGVPTKNVTGLQWYWWFWNSMKTHHPNDHVEVRFSNFRPYDKSPFHRATFQIFKNSVDGTYQNVSLVCSNIDDFEKRSKTAIPMTIFKLWFSNFDLVRNQCLGTYEKYHWSAVILMVLKFNENTSSQWPRWSLIFPIFGRMKNHECAVFVVFKGVDFR